MVQHIQREVTRESNSSQSTSSRSASNTTPTSKWHRDANMGIPYVVLMTLEAFLGRENGGCCSPFYFKDVIMENNRALHLSLPTSETNSLDSEFMSSKCSWTDTVLRLGRVGQIFIVLQIHDVFVVVLAFMLSRWNLGHWVTHVQSAHQPSVAA